MENINSNQQIVSNRKTAEVIELTDRPHTYRDFIETNEPMYISDKKILENFQDKTTPHQLAQDRYRENVIRLQLRDLNKITAVRQLGHETYELTQKGHQMLDNWGDTPSSDGLIEIQKLDAENSSDYQNINDFSDIDGETIKQINFEFAEDSDNIYGWIRGSPDDTRRKINNVAETDLHRIIREFPTNEPLSDQCAHWVRAFVGIHFFPDANHRTATNTIEYLVEQNNFSAENIIRQSINRTVLHSKFARTLHTDVRFNTLWEKDELFHIWHRYFTQVFHQSLERRNPHKPPTKKLDSCLDHTRSILSDLKN